MKLPNSSEKNLWEFDARDIANYIRDCLKTIGKSNFSVKLKDGKVIILFSGEKILEVRRSVINATLWILQMNFNHMIGPFEYADDVVSNAISIAFKHAARDYFRSTYDVVA